MFTWDSYPPDYRAREVNAITRAVLAGECVSIVGLSGAGKSNLMGFLSHRMDATQAGSGLSCRLVLVDCNRLAEDSPGGFLRLARQALGDSGPAADELQALDDAIGKCLAGPGGGLSLLLDRFDSLAAPGDEKGKRLITGNLRALRDAHKYRLTIITATRRPLGSDSELAELFYANTLWLGPLNESDARWNIDRYAARKGLKWDAATVQCLLEISRGYPAFLRAACEAVAGGAGLSTAEISAHPAVVHRLQEFWADEPGEEDLRHSGLQDHPLLKRGGLAELTAKEHLLLAYFQRRPGEVCEKDDLIRAAWPEDRIFEKGVRDDSLAQLVRRLREKIEVDPSTPRRIHTVPGRGYRYTP
jgi:hypothetical protein